METPLHAYLHIVFLFTLPCCYHDCIKHTFWQRGSSNTSGHPHTFWHAENSYTDTPQKTATEVGYSRIVGAQKRYGPSLNRGLEKSTHRPRWFSKASMTRPPLDFPRFEDTATRAIQTSPKTNGWCLDLGIHMMIELCSWIHYWCTVYWFHFFDQSPLSLVCELHVFFFWWSNHFR